MPTPADSARAANVSSADGQAQIAKANSDYANSFGGMAKSFVSGLWENSGIPEQWQSGQEAIDKPFIQKGQQGGKLSPAQIAEGVISAGAGTLMKLTAPLAPIFGNTGPKDPVGLSQAITAIANAPALKTPAGQAQAKRFQEFASSPNGAKAIRLAQDIVNASVIAGGIADGAEGFKPKVEGGFLETTDASGATEAPKTQSTEAPKPTPKPTAPTKTLAQSHADYARSQGYEPYTPHEQLPTIDMGPKAESREPVIQTGETPKTTPKPVAGDLHFEPVKPATTPAVRSTPLESRPEVPFSAEHAAPSEGAYSPVKPVASLGETRTPTLATKVRTQAIEKGLADTSEHLSQLPEYNKANMHEQRQFASDFVANEPDKAFRVAMGKELPPNHIIPEMVFAAVEKDAQIRGDGEMLNTLSNKSALTTQASAFGQRIRALAERDDTSPVRAIQDIQRARSSRATTTRVRAVRDEVRTAVRRSAPSHDDWSKFVEDITCNY